ncbi:uncharacterized protein [Ptychodera flava]|uniref:uncharacterized protein n=1 Tax=Ptychodera flava TaxID=63121 RepID=UPI00396AAB5E
MKPNTLIIVFVAKCLLMVSLRSSFVSSAPPRRQGRHRHDGGTPALDNARWRRILCDLKDRRMLTRTVHQLQQQNERACDSFVTLRLNREVPADYLDGGMVSSVPNLPVLMTSRAWLRRISDADRGDWLNVIQECRTALEQFRRPILGIRGWEQSQSDQASAIIADDLQKSLDQMIELEGLLDQFILMYRITDLVEPMDETDTTDDDSDEDDEDYSSEDAEADDDVDDDTRVNVLLENRTVLNYFTMLITNIKIRLEAFEHNFPDWDTMC